MPTTKDKEQKKTVIRICAEMRNWDAHSWMDGASHEHVAELADQIETAYREELKYLHEINQDLISTLRMALDQLTYYKQVVSGER